MLDRERIVDALATEWDELDRLLTELDDAQWEQETPLPGWRVRDIAAHLIGTELMLSGEPTPDSGKDVTSYPHVHNDVGARNEHYVEHFREQPHEAVLATFRDTTAARLESLRMMPDEEFHAPAKTPAGQDTYARFMRIRVFDCWMHEQDVRDAVGLPGSDGGAPADLSIDEITTALGFVVGKRASAPDGSRVTFELGSRTLHVAVDGRAKVVDSLPGDPTVRITLPLGVFTRLCGGRVDPAEALPSVSFEGDEALGEHIAKNLAFTI
ncbi:maleylpyruvate isomerase family mycothiol-dependent enzyme [Saccharopolyspora rhizosphaerae]|uniref:Maleylpyruvate isomerase family mycothiol-dependent enzyme n=1 Tax=Saccharopolyspora rhizosphaerae TaxID=2492662 RepID=A0A426JM42_9PSEU|nr:maleylpyruvate isomerase family mycothiol-dependent enzyme [Saccharopolyspora rhizosphaerae]RRO14282.1 maleylpyruvate isomerase family mycothiol-dependent enzyme [Saccharopolyspora rhizosphaerae]